MDKTKTCISRFDSGGRNPPHRGGQSSYLMHDPEVIFRELNLNSRDVFLDLGCGIGDYSIRAAEEVGEQGLVYATDIRKDLVDNLMKNAASAGLNNIRVFVSDIHDLLPFDDETIDVCFICTVLHCVDLAAVGKTLFSEINRVLKPKGRLIIIECKKEEMNFGPPLSMRISPDEIEGHAEAYGFNKTDLVDLGYNYMNKFIKKG